MPNIQLAKNLRVLRKSSCLTQDHLGTLLNITRQAYSNYENSKRTPDLDSLIRIAQIYNITLDQLVYQNIGAMITEKKGPYLPGINIITGDTIYLTEEEIEFLLNFRDLSKENKKMISSLFQTMNKKI